MNLRFLPLLGALLGALTAPPAAGQEHVATRLGNPATRFAKPLRAAADLRALFRNEDLKPDVAAILAQWGWPGDVEDLRRAAASAEITEWRIPVGALLPFMSSRAHGRPVTLRNVRWAGPAPAEAYAFEFVSRRVRYRCVTPKACSNFFLEEIGRLGPAAARLELACSAAADVLAGRPAEVWLTVRNSGDAPEPKPTVTLLIPDGATVTGVSEGGVVTSDSVVWGLAELGPQASRRVGAAFSLRRAGTLGFAASVRGVQAGAVRTECATRVLGVAGVLVQIRDDPDPVPIGETTSYTIEVTNQGTGEITNLQITARFPAPVSATGADGATAGQASDKLVVFAPYPRLPAKEKLTWKITAKGVAKGDSRLHVELMADQLTRPVSQEESTQVY